MPYPMRIKHEEDRQILTMKGEEFLYSRKAVGISLELAGKMTTLIKGKRVLTNGRPTQWINIKAALDERNVPAIAQLFGAQKTYPEFKSLFKDE